MVEGVLIDDLKDLIGELVGSGAAMEVLRDVKAVSDSTTILRIDDQAFRCVLQISPPSHPDVVAEASDRAHEFAAAVGLSLASPMLMPIAEGRHRGRSFAILPHRFSFSTNKLKWPYQRAAVAPAVLNWLARLSGRADVRNDDPANLSIYRTNLLALATQQGLDKDVRDAAEDAAERLERRQFEPRICPMHGDLWLGNILRAPSGFSYPFSVIDWRGSRVRGFPIFDLVRLSMSYRLSSRRLAREIARHAEIMGCSTTDAHGHLLAALGHYAINRGEMPLPNFLGMAQRCDQVYRLAMAC